ncbi:unnamed protein product [Umbelopsis ramanniana]|uniref:Eukaryotic translation initiation factor 3 subunit G n=1 Tax=Umbelopsis ramanniana AG TaxID=1314678 RepID=A0AAD5EE57_UMBRA|nr:uncharacterized protein K450DRAFT_230604 [Umbelopsis ramanniana AG]KAI8581667.1 hypothetical protein K450DRAFT_230604 [Umbelopsis ramanniana AG]
MPADTLAPTKPSWADEVEEEEDAFQTQVYTDENGLKVIVEYRDNDDGKKVKVTRKIKTKLVTEYVNKAVAERKKWAKFGEEKGNKPGPDLSTTTIGENIPLKLSSSYGKTPTAEQQTDEQETKMRQALKSKNIMCRICKGEHFTSKCPYKDTLQPLDEIAASLEGVKNEGSSRPESPEPSGGSGMGPNKYIAPHLRKGATAVGESPREKRDDSATLRVTNLSEDVTENDIYELFRRFGQISRVYLARDRETGVCKGFAFVSFGMKEEAERAQQAVNGLGYDSLILRVEFARSS